MREYDWQGPIQRQQRACTQTRQPHRIRRGYIARAFLEECVSSEVSAGRAPGATLLASHVGCRATTRAPALQYIGNENLKAFRCKGLRFISVETTDGWLVERWMVNPTIYTGKRQSQFLQFMRPHLPPHHRLRIIARPSASVPPCGQPYRIWKDAPTMSPGIFYAVSE